MSLHSKNVWKLILTAFTFHTPGKKKKKKTTLFLMHAILVHKPTLKWQALKSKLHTAYICYPRSQVPLWKCLVCSVLRSQLCNLTNLKYSSPNIETIVTGSALLILWFCVKRYWVYFGVHSYFTRYNLTIHVSVVQTITHKEHLPTKWKGAFNSFIQFISSFWNTA